MKKEKKIYVLMGASGSGKTTLGNFLKEQGIPEIISHTTRTMREGEVDGVTYYYVTKDEFDQIEKVEQVEYGGNFYCISKKEIDQKLQENDRIFVICDVNGMLQVKASYPEETTVIYISTNLKVMEERMRLRGDTEENIQKRLNYATETNELDNGKYADIILENNVLEETKQNLLDIVFGVAIK